MSFLGKVDITRAVNDEKVSAEIVDLTPDLARTKIDGKWWQYSDLKLVKSQEDQADKLWPWAEIATVYGKDILSSCVAVLSPEDYLEAAIAYKLGVKSNLEPGKRCLYIGWLAAAPRNRKWLCTPPIYKELGPLLLHRAIRESHLNGLGGRIALESLPTPKTVEFYETNGFVKTGVAPSEPSLINYELPLAAAEGWLQSWRI